LTKTVPVLSKKTGIIFDHIVRWNFCYLYHIIINVGIYRFLAFSNNSAKTNNWLDF
jgi:hypothetical protein